MLLQLGGMYMYLMIANCKKCASKTRGWVAAPHGFAGMSEPPASKRNWLEAMRTNAMIRKKPGAAAKEGAAAGGEAENVAPAGTGWTLAQRGSAAADTGQFKVLYRFNEGYTNAVKRPMLVKELL